MTTRQRLQVCCCVHRADGRLMTATLMIVAGANLAWLIIMFMSHLLP